VYNLTFITKYDVTLWNDLVYTVKSKSLIHACHVLPYTSADNLAGKSHSEAWPLPLYKRPSMLEIMMTM